jgi:head-tail adaptor
MSIRSNTDARRLDQRIEVQRKVETRDAIGDVIPSWVYLITTPAAVDSTKVSQERPGQDGIVLGQQLTFTIRADVRERFGIGARHRILWREQIYNIEAVVDNQLGGRLSTLYATTGLNRG